MCPKKMNRKSGPVIMKGKENSAFSVQKEKLARLRELKVILESRLSRKDLLPVERSELKSKLRGVDSRITQIKEISPSLASLAPGQTEPKVIELPVKKEENIGGTRMTGRKQRGFGRGRRK